ncbi:MAG: DUF2227 family putative metal-binding protein [Oligoflexia bacterium]|nr:DUF2227 family putative metal-binding protein [Oligoflexia bacterium]
MPKEKTHIKFNLLIGMPLGILIVSCVYLLFYKSIPNINIIAIFTLALLFNTFILNPDLDMANYHKLRSLKGFILLPFFPYSLIFKHRGISHSIFFGSITRIVYLIILVFVGYEIVFFYQQESWPSISQMRSHIDIIFSLSYNPIKENIANILLVIVTLWYGDLLHILLDHKRKSLMLSF